MKHLSTFLLLGLSTVASAQPVLTELNSSPQIGQAFALNGSAYQTAPAGGPNQLWDFSTLASMGTVTVQFVNPATTASGSNFSSDVAEIATGSPETRYYENESFGLFLEGFAHTNGFVIPYSGGSSLLQRPYPCAFQDTWSGQYGGTTFFQGLQLFIDGDYEGEADGHGTLEMPWGTVTDVLRIHLVITQTQAIVGAQSDFIEEYYEYYTPGVAYPLIRTFDKKEVLNGGGTVQMDQTLIWMSPVALGLPENPVTTKIALFPNPAHDAVLITGGANLSSLELLDASGRVVRSEGLGTVSSTEHRFALTGIAPGAYIVRMSYTDGRQQSQRLVVE